jgi:hypothetical protein
MITIAPADRVASDEFVDSQLTPVNLTIGGLRIALLTAAEPGIG